MSCGPGGGVGSHGKSLDVQSSLLSFLQQYAVSSSPIKKEDIDEIVLSYVGSILEDLGSDPSDLAFDADDFIELLRAYVPGIDSDKLQPGHLTQWIFDLAEEKRSLEAPIQPSFDLKSVIEESTMSRTTTNLIKGRNAGVAVACSEPKQPQRINRLSETSDGGSENSLESEQGGFEFQQSSVDHLTEMFPYACSLEISHCLTLSAGNIDEAAHLIMHRHETDQSIQQPANPIKINKKIVNEKDIKDRIVGQYGFVDQAEDLRYHRPAMKKSDDKKMIRYRDGKIVSTKGERFTQVTKQESEEMKKSYVNIHKDF